MSTNQFNRIFGFDFLRALAIFLVVVSHITFLVFPEEENLIITAIRILGAIGVDLFFVLSGYLIGGILLKQVHLNKINFKDLLLFWKRRWLRTLPNYYLVLILNVVIFIILGKQLPDQLGFYFLFLQNFSSPHPDFFTEAWSLSIEEYAYLFLPMLLFLSFTFFKRVDKQKLFIIMTIIVICFLTLFKLEYYVNSQINSYYDWSSSFRKVVIYRIDSIYMGFVLVYIMNIYKKFCSTYKKLLLYSGVFIFAFIHFVMFTYDLTPESNPFFYVFVYLQVVLCSIVFVFPYFSTLNYSGFFFKPIQFLSIHSYSIYLVNYSLVLLSLQGFISVENMSFFEKTGITVLFLGITLLLSTIIYRFFELPILKYRDRKYIRN